MYNTAIFYITTSFSAGALVNTYVASIPYNFLHGVAAERAL